ncbi:MAG: ABC transporter permease, partial [Planctomycetota bacterium]|nr:ABC transporter permease [Planctomycetota bacterium]
MGPFANPEFLRLWRSKLRPRQMILLGGITALVLGMILGIWYWIEIANNSYSRSKMMTGYFFVVVGLQMAIVSFYGLIQSAQSVSQEKERFTFEFQRLVAMGPSRLVLGKILGAPSEAFFMAAVGAFFAFLPVLSGDIPFGLYVWSMLVLAALGLAVSAMGVCFSSLVEKTQRATGLATAVPMLIFFAHFILVAGRFGSVNVWTAASPYVAINHFGEALVDPTISPGFRFFGSTVPLLAGYFAWQAFLAAFFYGVAVRRLQDEEYSFLSPWQAILTFAALQFVLLGDYAGARQSAGPGEYYTGQPLFFHGVNLALLMLLAFALTPSGELLRGRLHRARRDEHWKLLFEWPNRFQDTPAVFTVLVLGAGYAFLALALSLALDVLNQQALAITVMIAAMGLAVAGMLLYIQAYLERAGLRAGVVLLAIFLIVPPVIVGYLTYSWQQTAYINPISYLTVVGTMEVHGEHFRRSPGIGATWTFPLVALAAALLLPALAAMRLRYLIDLYALELEKERKLAEEKPAPAARTPQAARAALA